MFTLIKNILLNTEDVDLIQPRWEGDRIYLEILFRTRKHPIRVPCDTEDEMDLLFQSITEELTMHSRKRERHSRTNIAE